MFFGKKKALIVHFGGIGDAIIALYFLDNLYKKYAFKRLDVMCSEAGARKVFEGVPCVNSIYKNLLTITLFQKVRLIFKLYRMRYDIIIISPISDSIKLNFLGRIINARILLGFSNRQISFLTHRLCVKKNKHKVKQWEQLFKLMDPSFKITLKPDLLLACKQYGLKILSEEDLNIFTTHKIAVIHAGCKNKVVFKQWPIDKYNNIIKKLLSCSYEIILIGDEEERNNYAKHIIKDSKIFNLAGKLSIPQAILIISKCSLFISGDSGMMHIASCLGVNMVSIFGPTDPQFTGPFMRGENCIIVRSELNCAPCYFHGGVNCREYKCMQEISSDCIWNEVKRITKVYSQSCEQK